MSRAAQELRYSALEVKNIRLRPEMPCSWAALRMRNTGYPHIL
jgi:hypothetical protein